MKPFTLILFVIFLQVSLLKADGFYIGGSVGTTIKQGLKINTQQQATFNQQTIDNTQNSYTVDNNKAGINIYNDITISDSYSSILKEISYSNSQYTPIFASMVGYGFKNLRFEGEIKNVNLKIKPKKLYDIAITQNSKGTITTYCSQIDYVNTCKNGDHVDSNSSDFPNCPILNDRCYKNIINIDTTNSYNYSNVYVDDNNLFFSDSIDSVLFSNAEINSNNILGFINFLYELGITKNIVAFAGLGAGYGVAILGGDLLDKQNITYPAYQAKLGAYYALNSNIDITLSYSNINMIGKANKGNFELSNNNIQAVEFGIRYNFFNRSTSFAEDYNYRKIFRLP